MVSKVEMITDNHPGILGFILAGLSFVGSIVMTSLPYLQVILVIAGIISALLAIRRELINKPLFKSKKKQL